MRPIKVDPKQAAIEISRAAQASPLGEDAIITSEHLAVILHCSSREVAKLRKAVRLPPAIKLGRQVRWHLGTIRYWVQCGCKG